MSVDAVDPARPNTNSTLGSSTASEYEATAGQEAVGPFVSRGCKKCSSLAVPLPHSFKERSPPAASASSAPTAAAPPTHDARG